jgi:hypothetical protein
MEHPLPPRIENPQVLAALAELKKNLSDLASNHSDASLPEEIRAEIGLALQELQHHVFNLITRLAAEDQN